MCLLRGRQGLFGNIPGQDLQQRVFAAKDANTASRACILAGLLYLVFGSLPLLLGFASLVTHPGSKLDPVAYLANAYLSPAMLIVFVIAVVSMIVSTATSAVLAPATILGHNLLVRVPYFQNERALFRDRLSVVLVSIGGLCIALLGESLMGLLDIALSIQLSALFVPVLFGIYGRQRNQTCCVLAMLFGFFTWSFTHCVEVWNPTHSKFFLSSAGYSVRFLWSCCQCLWVLARITSRSVCFERRAHNHTGISMTVLPIENTEGRACDTCRFWRKQALRDENDWGQCRRMPPILPDVVDDKLVVAGIWPSTKAGDWCGEWEAATSGGADDPSP